MFRVPKDGITRDWWGGDHFWHVDGTRWEQQAAFTVIGCLEAEEGAPGTELLDTSKLFDITREDGFWEEHQLTIDDVRSLRSVFADSTYWAELLPRLRETMSDTDKKKLDKNEAYDIERANCKSPQEFLDKKDIESPPKQFDLVQQTLFSGRDSLFLDAGGRNSRLLGPDGKEYTPVLHALRERYLTGRTPEELGLVTTVAWEAGRCLIFPQVGTLHRALPGNDCRRKLHLGFLLGFDIQQVEAP